MARTKKITPFWNRIPSFFLYGFKGAPLLLEVSVFFISYFLGGWLFNIVLSLVAIKYGAEVLKRTMEGELQPPKLNMEVINANFLLPIKLIVVFLIYIFAFSFLMHALGALLAIPLYIIMMLLIPALVISFVVSEEMFFALNPANWLHIASSIGWPYLIMVLFLSLADGIPYMFAMIADAILPDEMMGPFILAIRVYYMSVVFHMMGYVVFQYHEKLGTDIPAALLDDEEHRAEMTRTSPLLQQFMEDGNVVAAANEFWSLVRANPEDLELRRRMYVYLKSNGQFDLLKEYAPDYFQALARQQSYSDAAALYQESVVRGDNFTPPDPAHYLPVVRELRRRQGGKQAVMMVQGFHKRFPDDHHTPELYLELAQILSEELNRDDLAKQALTFIISKFPDHKVIPRARQYLALLSQLQGAQRPG